MKNDREGLDHEQEASFQDRKDFADSGGGRQSGKGCEEILSFLTGKFL